jgi:RNA:NAD 2'-phosphotransferase (TPT1/KptA family)
VLAIDAAGMHRNGHTFYRAANGVWLTATSHHNGSADRTTEPSE